MSIRIGFAILFSLALLLGASLPAAAQSDSQQTSEQMSGGDKSANEQAPDEKSKASGDSQSQTQAKQAQFITRQESSQVLASSIIGMTIQDSTGKKAQQIGSVNDLIMNEQNQVVGVVVGVGGFLGMGEKNVGIPVDAVENIDSTKNIAVVTVSKKQLQNAPTFTTKQEQKQKQKQQQQQQKMKQQSQQTSSSTLDSTGSGG